MLSGCSTYLIPFSREDRTLNSSDLAIARRQILYDDCEQLGISSATPVSLMRCTNIVRAYPHETGREGLLGSEVQVGRTNGT